MLIFLHSGKTSIVIRNLNNTSCVVASMVNYNKRIKITAFVLIVISSCNNIKSKECSEYISIG